MAPGVIRPSSKIPSRLVTPASALRGAAPVGKPGPSTDPWPAQPQGRGVMYVDEVYALNSPRGRCTYYGGTSNGKRAPRTAPADAE